MLQIGDKVSIHPDGFDQMLGIVDRIVKMSGPCQPTEDQSQWTVHVIVQSNHPRNSGLFCINYLKVLIA